MNLVSGKILEIYVEHGTTMGKVSVGGTIVRVPLLFVYDAKVGDTVLMESGVAISRIEPQPKEEV